jgi:hypothetical protein
LTLLRDIGGELLGMFMADVRLSGAILALVLIVAGLILWGGVQPLIAGGGLLLGSLVILIEAVCREARGRKRS